VLVQGQSLEVSACSITRSRTRCTWVPTTSRPSFHSNSTTC
jgi:hypothetical protein